MRERNIENEILKQNKIPGCDQLTRPEEVKALSKYLKSIRTTQENHTSLEKDNLEIPGRTTGKIPVIDSLEDYVDPLDGVRGIKSLYKESSREPLSDNKTAGDPGLYTEKTRENLYNPRKTTLEKHREDLNKKAIPEPTLGDRREELTEEPKEIKSLESHAEGLEGVREVANLYVNTKETLRDTSPEPTLGKTREGLIDNHNPELDLTRIDLEGFRDLSYKEQLEVDSKNELDTTRVGISKSPEGISELGNHQEPLTKTPESPEKLPGDRVGLEETGGELKELGNHQEKLRPAGNDISELSDARINFRQGPELEDLPDKKEPITKTPTDPKELGNHIEGLRKNQGKDLEELPGAKEMMRPAEEEISRLGKTRIDLRDNPEELTELGDTIIGMEGEIQETELGDTRIDLGGTQEAEAKSLEDTRINLSGTSEAEPTELEDYREGLEVSEDNFLEDERIDLENTSEYEMSELEDYRDPLEAPGNNFLEDTRIDLTGTSEAEPTELEDYREGLSGAKEAEMSSLEDKRLDIEVPDDNALEDTRIDLEGTSEAEVSGLEDERIDLTGVSEAEMSALEDERLDLSGVEETDSLEDERLDLTGTQEAEPESLEDFIDKIDEPEDRELEDEKIELPEAAGDGFEGYNPLGPDELENLGGDLTNFYESILEIPEASQDSPRQSGDYTPLGPTELDSLGGNLGNFYDSILEVPEDTEENHVIEELEDTKIDFIEDTEEEHVIEELEDTILDIPEDEEDNHVISKLEDTKHKTPEAQAPSGQNYEYSKNQKLSEELVDGLAYKNHETSGKTIRAKAEAGENGMHIGGIVGDLIGDDRGHPEGKKGKEKQKELNICLRNLTADRDAKEILKGTWRSRLPGNNSGAVGDLLSGGIGGMVDGIVDNVVSSAKENIGNAIFGDNFMEIDITNPMNRPDSLLDKGMDAIEGLFGRNDKDGWTAANNRITSSMPDSANIYATSKWSEAEKELHSKIVGETSDDGSKSFWGKVGDIAKNIVSDALLGKESNYKLKANYLSGKGIETTLEELCGKTVGDVSSLGDLYTVLKQSPFFTTPDKFTSAGYSGYKAQTLDTNAFWEVVLEPYAGEENGNLSYLPGIHEINIRNIVTHGVNTAYNKWIPFTGFDLQKSKLTNKTLSLYDGEISYPVSMEFTNELRLTIADDQYKSWRRYFEECAKAAVYNSEGHDPYYYLYAGNGQEYTLTAIDTSNVCIAMYKNICFRCLIYISTPQYSNIQKFDLLMVMKDFSTEYTGEVDGGAGDLTVSFSIVGENPKGVGDLSNKKTIDKYAASYDKRETSSDYTSILSGGINAVGKLIG